MPAIDVVSDASVALKWFHSDGEEEVDAARALLELHRSRAILLHVLDLTFYELGNALLRGRAAATHERAAEVLDALRDICVVIAPEAADLRLAAKLAAEHDLTVYDAAYAAVASRRRARLVTLDRELLTSARGVGPASLVAELRPQ